jgi:hypothetical protein
MKRNQNRMTRAFVSIALLRLSEGDLRDIHKFLTNVSPTSFVNFVRDIEDEIDSSLSMAFQYFEEGPNFKNAGGGLYREIDLIRKDELGVSVKDFAELLELALSEVLSKKDMPIPRFDSRRGLQAWIDRLTKNYGEQIIYEAAIKILNMKSISKRSDWRLR